MEKLCSSKTCLKMAGGGDASSVPFKKFFHRANICFGGQEHY